MPELLIIQPFSLGGVAHGLQVAASIKAQQPGWNISWIVRDLFAPLMRASTVVDRVYVFRRHDGARSFLRLMREVRRKEFDVVMDMQGLLRSGLMAKWSRAKRKIGRADAREGAALLYGEHGAAAGHRRRESRSGNSSAILHDGAGATGIERPPAIP